MCVNLSTGCTFADCERIDWSASTAISFNCILRVDADDGNDDDTDDDGVETDVADRGLEAAGLRLSTSADVDGDIGNPKSLKIDESSTADA